LLSFSCLIALFCFDNRRIDIIGNMASQVRDKTETSDFEVDSQDLHLQSRIKTIRLIDGARLGLTGLALLMGISTMGLGADTLNVYQTTHVSQDFLLPLWPDQFDLRPTTALVVGATIVVLTNIVSVVFGKVKFLRSRTAVHTPLTFVAPFIGLVAAIIAMTFFYAVNESDTVDTLLSWTCRWGSLNMMQQPHFGTLCKESWAGVYMSILLIPVEAAVLGLAGWQLSVERHTSAYSAARKSSSPILA
jgi:uncharacterized membrane protein